LFDVVVVDELLSASWMGPCTRSSVKYVSLFFWNWLWNRALYVVASCHRTLGFMSPSEPMRHSFENDAPYIKLWGASFRNCPMYFGQPENGDQRVLSSYASSCVSFIRDFDSVTPLFSVTPILGVWSENIGVMLSKSQTEDTCEVM
jgi:hypothetical protein